MPKPVVFDDDVVESYAVTADDHATLEDQLGPMADSDLAATHQYLHDCAQRGQLIPGFSKPAMETFHGAVEDEQASRANAVGQRPPAPTPLQWSSGGALSAPLSDANAARMPGHVTTIAKRAASANPNLTPSLRDIPQAEREAMDDEDFAGKGQSFPIKKPKDVDAAWHSIGRAGPDNYSPEKLKANIIKIAKRKGPAFTYYLPKGWQDGTEDHADHEIERLSTYSLIDEAPNGPKGERRSWIQVARTIDDAVSSRYGKFSITKDQLRTMLSNFESTMPQPPTRIPVDYDHLSMDPQRPEDGKAAGWFLGLELRNDDSELWGLIEWTARAANAIEQKEYQFVSPSFARNYTDKHGKKQGPTLLAAAITNHPFLEGMAPLTLCADGDLAIALMQGPTVSQVHTPTEVRVHHMAKKTFKMTDTKGNPVEVDEDEMDNSAYVKSMKADHAKALKKASDDAVDAARKDMRADTDSEVVSLKTSVTSLKGEVIELRAGRENDRKGRLVDRATLQFDRLVAQGKALPGERDRAIKLAKRDVEASTAQDDQEKVFDLFADWCADHAKVIVKLRAIHGHAEGVDGDGNTNASDDPEEQLMQLTAAKATTLKITESEALGLVAKEKPELYARAMKATTMVSHSRAASDD